MEAVDLFIEKPITELKEVYPNIRYTQVTLVLVKHKNSWHPAVWYMRGATLKAYLDILREDKLKPKDYIARKVFVLETQKYKKGTVLYYTPSLVALKDPSDKEQSISSPSFQKLWIHSSVTSMNTTASNIQTRKTPTVRVRV